MWIKRADVVGEQSEMRERAEQKACECRREGKREKKSK